MPKLGMRQEFEIPGRQYGRTLKAEIGITVDGRELPNSSVMGETLDIAVALVIEKIKQSYEKVPTRTSTPFAQDVKQ